MTATNFRLKLETVGKIHKWDPTNLQLHRIAKKFVVQNISSIDGLHRIISEECPGTVYRVFEGLDNTDLRTLLALATTLTTQGT